MKTVRVVFVSMPRDEAREMSKGIVENRLAACVNIVPKIESYFRWEDKVEFDEEALLVIKTTEKKFPALMAYVKEQHPYELPEIIAVPLVDALPEYVTYVKTETEKE